MFALVSVRPRCSGYVDLAAVDLIHEDGVSGMGQRCDEFMAGLEYRHLID